MKKIEVNSKFEDITNNKHQKFEKILILSVIGFIIALIFGIYTGWKPLVNAIVNAIPYKYEVELSKVISKSSPFKEASKVESLKIQYIESKFKLLSPGIPYPYNKVTFHIQNDKRPNAFALPGGHIILTEGFLEELESPEELLGVIAHEVAHISHRHSLKTIVHTSGIYILASLLIGDFSGFIAVAADQGALLMNRSYSRGFEQEADTKALEYLQKANISPIGLILFLQKMLKHEQTFSTNNKTLEKVSNFYSTHPITQDRIKYLNNKLNNFEQNHNFVKIEFDKNRLINMD